MGKKSWSNWWPNCRPLSSLKIPHRRSICVVSKYAAFESSFRRKSYGLQTSMSISPDCYGCSQCNSTAVLTFRKKEGSKWGRGRGSKAVYAACRNLALLACRFYPGLPMCLASEHKQATQIIVNLKSAAILWKLFIAKTWIMLLRERQTTIKRLYSARPTGGFAQKLRSLLAPR